MDKLTSGRVVLDWTRLLGFDQVEGRNNRAEQIGAKVGDKPPVSPRLTDANVIGAKVGDKGNFARIRELALLGAKVGLKITLG